MCRQCEQVTENSHIQTRRNRVRTLFGVLAVLVAIAATGCSTEIGQKFNQEKMAEFKPGKTTYDEVVKALGAPISSNFISGGKKQCTWAHAHSGPMLPFMSYSSTSETVMYIFDVKGVMTADTNEDNALTRAAKQQK